MLSSNINKEIESYVATEPTHNRSKFVSKTGSIEDYDFGDLLGKGSYGEVYQAKHRDTGIEYAVKIYDKYRMSEEKKKKSMYNEIRLLKKLDHPNLIKLHAVHETVSKIYLVMDLVKGSPLSEYSRSICKHRYFIAITYFYNIDSKK